MDVDSLLFKYFLHSGFFYHLLTSNFMSFSSPEPKSPWKDEKASSSSVRPFTLSKDFSSETNGQNVTKFHMWLPESRGTKLCLNGLGHVTNVAAMPVYGETSENLLLQN